MQTFTADGVTGLYAVSSLCLAVIMSYIRNSLHSLKLAVTRQLTHQVMGSLAAGMHLLCAIFGSGLVQLMNMKHHSYISSSTDTRRNMLFDPS